MTINLSLRRRFTQLRLFFALKIVEETACIVRNNVFIGQTVSSYYEEFGFTFAKKP